MRTLIWLSDDLMGLLAAIGRLPTTGFVLIWTLTPLRLTRRSGRA